MENKNICSFGCEIPKDLIKVWVKFHWENYSHSKVIPVNLPEDQQKRVIVLQVTGEVKEVYYLGIMDEERRSMFYGLSRIVGDGFLAIEVPSWPCSFFVTSKNSGLLIQKGLARPKFQENTLGLKWVDEKYYDSEDPKISHFDLCKCPSQLE